MTFASWTCSAVPGARRLATPRGLRSDRRRSRGATKLPLWVPPRRRLDVLRSITDGGAWLYEVDGIDAVHASPPCQAHVKGMAAVNRKLGRELGHVDLIAATREALDASGFPYVIESRRRSVEESGAALRLKFRLPLRRHRLFETTFPIMVPPCNHAWQHEAKYWTSNRHAGEMRRAKVVRLR